MKSKQLINAATTLTKPILVTLATLCVFAVVFTFAMTSLYIASGVKEYIYLSAKGVFVAFLCIVGLIQTLKHGIEHITDALINGKHEERKKIVELMEKSK